jgi:hypothetical protein
MSAFSHLKPLKRRALLAALLIVSALSTLALTPLLEAAPASSKAGLASKVEGEDHFDSGDSTRRIVGGTNTVVATPTTCNMVTLLDEGFESGTLGVFTSTVIITSSVTPSPTPGWAAVASNPHSGTNSAYAPDPDKITDSRLSTVNSIVIPVGVTTATLTFWHRFTFENLFDGAVLEVSTDAGTTWTDADANIQQGGYNSTIVAFPECITADARPPFPPGKRVWTSSMPNYSQVKVNLLPYAGTPLKFRFRIGTDCAVGGQGWNIDDVLVTYSGSGGACATVTATSTPPTPTATRSATTTNTTTATPTTCTIVTVLDEGFESGTLGAFNSTAIITSPVTPVPTPGWASVASNPHSGTNSAFAPDPDRVTDSRLTLNNSIVIPPGVTTATLTFWHRFALENYWDGGVLEVSTDAGATWRDAEDNIEQGEYNGKITILVDACPTPGTPNPFPGGKRVWTGSQTEYSQVRVNLLPYAGTPMKFRFRLGTDCATPGTGWNIDDIVVSYSNASGVCPTITPPLPTGTGTTTITGTPTPPPAGTNTVVASVTQTSVASATPTNTTAASGTNTAVVSSTPTNTTIAGTATSTPTTCVVPFTDVDVDNPFYIYIKCLYCRGIISGYSDNTFRPYSDTTRGQMSKIVSNAAGFNDPVSGQTYTDVPPSHPFYVWIMRLTMHNVATGYDTGCPTGAPPCFKPENSITRGQMAKIDSNAAVYNDDIPPSQQTFTDVPPDSTFWVYIERLVLHDVVGGYPCGSTGEPCDDENRPYYRPKNNVTRGQSAKIVSNTFFPVDCTPGIRPVLPGN